MFPQKHKYTLGSLYAHIRYLLTLGIFLFATFVISLFGIYTYTRTLGTPDQKVYAATSSTLNFQGRLLSSSGNIVPDGYYNLEFKLYDGGTSGGPGGVGEANAGSNLWTETYYDSNGVTAGNDNRVRIVNGYFSVNLGSQTAFPSTINWDQELWLTMNVGGSTQTATPTWDGEMLAPSNKRTKLTAVPFAFKAQTALGVSSNNTSAASTNSSNVTIQSGNATGATSNSGNITIDVGTATQTAGTMSIGTANQTGLTIGRSGVSTALQGNVSIAGGTNYGVYYRDGSGNVVTTAAGTSGECFKANTGAAPTWGSCTGTGDFIQGGNAFSANAVLGTNDNFALEFETFGTTRAILQADGDFEVDTDTLFVDAANNRIGVGTASPGYTLDVDGDINTTGVIRISGTSICTSSGCIVDPASGIQNQSASDQTANFRISGTGRANTSFTSPLFDSISGGVSLGTSTATTVTIGGTANTTAVTIQGAATSTYTIGTTNNTGGITVGNSTATNTINIGTAAGNGNTQTINIGTSATAGSATNIVIGSTIGTSTTTINSGSGNITLQAQGASTIGIIQVGAGGAGSTTPDYLALDVKSTTGDPAGGAEGYMYYNTFDNKFRCYVNSAWVDCDTNTAGTVTLQQAYTNGSAGDQVVALSSSNDSIIFRNPSSSGSDSGYVLTIDQLSTGATGGLLISSAGSGDLLKVTDTTATARDVLTIANGGATTFRNQTDSTSAFNVQNAAGTSILNVDSTNSRVTVRGNASVATLGAELVTSQDFSNATYWSCAGWTTSVTDATHNTGNTNTCVATATNLTVSAGVIYQVEVTYSATNTSADYLEVSIGGQSAPWIITGSNTLTAIVETTTTGALTFTPTSDFDGTISGISVKLVTPATTVLSVVNSDASSGIEVRSGGSALSNTFIGISSGRSNIGGDNNTSLGAYSLQSNTDGYSNTGIGKNSLFSNTTGFQNTALGSSSLYWNTTGYNNIALGSSSLSSNTVGNYNIAIGVDALNTSLDGSRNLAIGYSTLSSNVSGSDNVALGDETLANTSTSGNTAIGVRGLYSNTTGTYNTSLGYRAGYTDGGFATSSNLQQATAIGAYSQVQQSNSLVLGRTSTGSNQTLIGIGTTAPTDLFSVSPIFYNTGTAGTGGVSSATVTGSGTTWTSDMVGMEIIFSNGTKATITAFTSTTSITVNPAITVANGTSYRIHNRAFYVTNTGSSALRSSTNSTTAFQIQNAAGTNVLTADTTNQRITIGSIGTAVGQLYISGSVPTTHSGSVNTGTNPLSIVHQNNYAYVTNHGSNTLQIFNIANPASPTSMGTVATGTNPHGVAVNGKYAYVANNGSDTIQVFNISNPASASSVGSLATDDSPVGVYVQGRYLYVLHQGTGDSLRIFDISNPATPVSVGSLAVGNNPYNLVVLGRYAYMTISSDSLLRVVDVSNPASPSSVGSVATGATPLGIYVQGNYAYVANFGGSMDIFNVSNPASPSLVGGVSGLNSPVRVYVQGNFAYLTDYGAARLYTIDITNPASPTSEGYVTTSTDPAGITVNGRYAYVVAWTTGNLRSYDLGGAYVQQLEAGGINTTTLDVKNNANIDGNLNLKGALQVTGGAQITGGISIEGNSVFRALNDSTTAFQIQNAGGTSLLTVDSTTTSSNLVTYESPFSGWNNKGASSSSVNSTQYYQGTSSLQVITTAAANQGQRNTSFALAANTTYNFSMYVKLANGSTNTLVLGRQDDNATDTDCSTSGPLVTSNGWTLLSCTFTTGSSITGGGNIYIKQTDATARTWYMDSMHISKASLLSNPGVEVAVAGNWIAKGASTVTRDTVEYNNGSASVKTVTAATAGQGVRQNLTLSVSTTYNLSFYAKLDSGSAAFATMEAGYSSDGSTDNTVCTTARTVVTTGWIKYSCTFTTPSSTSGTPYVYIKQTDANAHTWYVDDVMLTAGSNISTYREGGIKLNANITSALQLQNQDDSTQALSVQNSLGSYIFNVDTLNSRVGINTTTSSYDLSFGESSNRTLGVETRTTNAAGSSLTISAGAAGSGASAFAGGVLTLQGGAAGGTGNANGGAVTIAGGAGVGTGTQGLVNLSTSAFTSAAVQTFAASGSLTAGNVDLYSSLPVLTTASGVIVTVPDPAQSTIGRLLYIAARDNSIDFTLRLNSARTPIDINMKENSTATLIWNGTDWTAAGASSSTDLQAAYNNTIASAGGAELVLNAPGGNADGLTVRNNATTPITGGLLEVQTSIGSNLFTVNNNATEYATNGGAETVGASASTFPANTWDTTTGGTVDRWTTVGDNIATGQASVRVQTTAVANEGARNRITTSLTSGLTYTVSFAARGATNFSTLQVLYSPDGTTSGTTQCATAQTVTSGQWTRITCSFVASGTITSSNSILIRQTDATSRTFYIDNLSINVNASATYAVDGSVDLALGSNWTNFGTLDALTRETTIIYDTSGSVLVNTPNSADRGVRNNLPVVPATSTQYLVTFYARSSNTFNDIRVRYTRDGGTNFVSCVDYNTQVVSTTAFTEITCLFTTDSTTATDPDLVIDQPTGSDRIFYIDALSVTLNTNNSNNVQIGGANKGGPVTLFTLDRSAGAPIAANNEAYLGSMYYDTTTGRIQCYEADGWGACGAAPDNIVNLNPEYAGAVLNGTGVGTMTADFCSDDTALTVNAGLCETGEAKNYYRWTSPQATQQTYSVYVTYQLPATFNGFSSDDTVQLVGRVDSTTNAEVTYQMFKSTGSAVTACGTETDVIAGGGDTANAWHSYGINGNEATGCSFTSSSAGDFIIFKINLKANSNANAYVSTLSFITTGR